ncbi:MAG: HAMP domain-containing protein [Ignavibacteriae bacterium]|nr:HAMP domain-containing protein [Ignavibacteria bacterium]MBI3364342.1 HAMP domain-containing protein [Ignavibacteriota bacterium]
MRFLKSIRVKLTLWYSFLLLTTLVAFGIVAYVYTQRQLAINLDKSLKYEALWFKNNYDPKTRKAKAPGPLLRRVPRRQQIVQPQEKVDEFEIADSLSLILGQVYTHLVLHPNKTYIEVSSNKTGAILFHSHPIDTSIVIEEFPRDTVGLQTLHNGTGVELRVASVETDKLSIIIAYPLGELGEVLDDLFRIFVLLIPIALGVSLAGGWLLAFISLRPVDEVTKTAREISASNLGKQIPESGVDDEIGRLISTFNDMITRLRQSFDQIKQFSSDASHELRTPLTIMRGEVELALRSSKSPEEYRRVLVSNLEEILRLATIIDSLLEFSKSDPDLLEIAFEKVNLKEILAELYEDSEVIAEKKHISVTLEKNEDVVIVGDAVRLRQLFLNLVDNAVKYTPEHGHVTLCSERQNGFVQVKVRDDGIGIPKEDQQRIFNRFYRVEKGRSREMGGSGLGLSIAKSIVLLHRGRIEVESDPGNGATFTVFLPVG